MSNDFPLPNPAKDAISVQIEALYTDMDELEQLVALLQAFYSPPGQADAGSSATPGN